MKITATIITLNEAENIRAACDSVKWADEILVIDANSGDATREIARECGARVLCHDWPGFALQKEFAAEAATNDWIFSLDADERVSPDLKRSIEELKNLPEHQLTDGYRIARKSFYMGRWIQGGGWYPDYQLRLYRKTRAKWSGAFIHESVKMTEGSRTGQLRGDILHYSVANSRQHHRMIGERYAPLSALQMFREGRRTSAFLVALTGPAAFLRSYVLHFGFRDGLAGYCIARFAAHNAFLKHLMLWELQQNHTGLNGPEEMPGFPVNQSTEERGRDFSGV